MSANLVLAAIFMTLKYIILTLFILVPFVGCENGSSSDDNLINNMSVQSQDSSFKSSPSFVINKQRPIEGSWEIRRSFSGWTGEHIYGVGNGNTYVFSKSRYAAYSNHMLIENGTYEIHTDSINNFDTRRIFNCIIFNDERWKITGGQKPSPTHISFEVGNRDLEFTYIGWSDIGPSIFARIN